MLRFRFTEDERRYLRLLGHAYRTIARHLPQSEMSSVLRDLGKIQDILWLEGVRQGVSATVLASADQTMTRRRMGAFQIHAEVYGERDTPLHEAERAYAQALDLVDALNDPWMDNAPMQFAPEVTPESGPPRGAFPAVQHEAVTSEQAEPEPDQDPGELSASSIMDAVEEAIRTAPSPEESQEQPAMLDRVREELVAIKKGDAPESWEKLIFALHLRTGIDAGFLDLQLGTPMGQAVLEQAGFLDMQPGPFGTDLGSVRMLSAEELRPNED